MDYDAFALIRIVLVDCKQAGNIGAAARAMKNMALSSLYLVNPSHFPSAEATARASAADDILANAHVCTSLRQALLGCHLVIGCSARQRSIQWQQLDAVGGCHLAYQRAKNNQQVAIVFGTENAGLTNAQLDLCQALITIPTSQSYASLNVAAAVQVIAYQLLMIGQENKPLAIEKNENLASFNQLEHFYRHLESTLVDIDYADKEKPIALLMRRLRRIFHKAQLSTDEVQILRGILKTINKK